MTFGTSALTGGIRESDEKEYFQQHARCFVSVAKKIITEKKESANLFLMHSTKGYGIE